MKLVIGWLVLMLILPLIYLFWWKKSWRVALGIVILAILVLGFFIPSEVTYSLVNRKIKKEQKNLIQQKELIKKQLNGLRDKDFSSPSSSESPEKITLEKEIVELKKEIDKVSLPWLEWYNKKKDGEEAGSEPKDVHSPEFKKKQKIMKEKSQEWIKKWGKVKSLPCLFFQGEELTQGLKRLDKSYNEEHMIWTKGFPLKHKENSLSVIDFSNNNKIETAQKEITKLIKKSNQELESYKSFTGKAYIPLIWFKNIDKIKKKSKLESLILSLFTSKKNNVLWDNNGEKNDFSEFIFIASSADYKSLSPTLKTKLNQFELFLDKHSLTIILVTGVGEIIILLLLINFSRKDKSKNKIN